MLDWRHYWNHNDQVFNIDPLRQVGKTVNGKIITPDILDDILNDIVLRLDLKKSDSLLDLCCGNGLLTHRIAKRCRSVTGVDFSSPLIDVATHDFRAANINYVCADVTEMPESIRNGNFDKFLMYEAIQQLDPGQASTVFHQVASMASPGASFYIASIPDQDCKWRFYDTPERKREYERRLADGTELIGTWWTKVQLLKTVSSHGFEVEILDRSEGSHGSHYRFDALCVKSTGSSC
jgi:cyclopropane fatty-acyl-phospholipid synthase-like methyltransferase